MVNIFWDNSNITGNDSSGFVDVRSDGREPFDNACLNGRYYVTAGTPNGVLSLKATLNKSITDLAVELGTFAVNAATGQFKYHLDDNPYTAFKMDFTANNCATTKILIYDNFQK